VLKRVDSLNFNHRLNMSKWFHTVRYPHPEKRNFLGLVSKAYPPKDIVPKDKQFQPKVVLKRLRLKQLGLIKGKTSITYKKPCRYCKISMCACRWYAALKRKTKKLIEKKTQLSSECSSKSDLFQNNQIDTANSETCDKIEICQKSSKDKDELSKKTSKETAPKNLPLEDTIQTIVSNTDLNLNKETVPENLPLEDAIQTNLFKEFFNEYEMNNQTVPENSTFEIDIKFDWNSDEFF